MPRKSGPKTPYKKRRRKYNVSPKKDRTVDGITFHSKKEMTRYLVLRDLQKESVISNLKLQPKYPCVVNGKKICDYYADFIYTDSTGKEIVEDVKGYKTSIYRLKKKLVEAIHNITITET